MSFILFSGTLYPEAEVLAGLQVKKRWLRQHVRHMRKGNKAWYYGQDIIAAMDVVTTPETVLPKVSQALLEASPRVLELREWLLGRGKKP